mgnify:CR=1 FL=1
MMAASGLRERLSRIERTLAGAAALAVFAALGIGYWVGNFRIAGFSLGGVTGSLLAGIFVGWLFDDIRARRRRKLS